MIKELYKYRELLKTNVKKDIRGKYKGSFLGVLWSFINPLLSVLVYAIIFPFIMRTKIDNYLIYLVVGIIPWTFFTNSINQGMISILINAGIIKKVYFPRIILPISSVTSSLVNFLISCLIILVFVIFSGIGISPYLLFLPLVIIIQFILTLGFVFAFSAIEIYARDVEYIVNFLVTMLFYATPILYDPSIFPKKLQFILNLNPLTYIINGYRDIFYYKQMPNFIELGIVFVISIIIFIVGYLIFKKLEKGFAEEV